MDDQIYWRINEAPRFTALEFGAYMASDDGPRETILRDMKYERMARTLSYRDLYIHIAKYLSSPTRNRTILAECRQLLENAKTAS